MSRASSGLIVSALVSAIFAAACGPFGGAPAASPSPPASPIAGTSPTPSPGTKPSPVPSPAPTASYAILVSQAQGAGQPFTVSLVDVSGKVAASASGTLPANPPHCPGAAAVLPYPTVVSASNSRVYFLDGGTTIKSLTAAGKVATVMQLAGGSNLGYVFAVSPDDARIALTALDFSSAQVKITLSVGTLGQGALTQIFANSDSFGLWPVGWHAGQLVLAKVSGCTQGGGPFTAFPVEYHLNDPATAVRTATLGSLDGCRTVSYPASPGVLCSDFRAGRLNLLGWDGRAVSSWADPGLFQYAVSPAGAGLGCCEGQKGPLLLEPSGATSTINIAAGSIGWVDAQHLIAVGSGPQGQTVIYDIGAKQSTPVAVQGTYAGRLPGGLDR